MQFQYLHLLIIVLVSITMAPAQADTPEERIDRAQYNWLVTEIRRIDADFTVMVNGGLEEARENGGKADLTTQSKILALRDRRDRRMTRASIIALRWGWELPEFNAQSESRTSRPLSEKETMFAPAGHILQTRFSNEAKAIARRLVLPIISIPEKATVVTEEESS